MAPWLGELERRARGDIPGGNSLGQGFTSTSTLTHVWGAYGAPTLGTYIYAAGVPLTAPSEHAIDVHRWRTCAECVFQPRARISKPSRSHMPDVDRMRT